MQDALELLQIRVHSAHLGFPMLGDEWYGIKVGHNAAYCDMSCVFLWLAAYTGSMKRVSQLGALCRAPGLGAKHCMLGHFRSSIQQQKRPSR